MRYLLLIVLLLACYGCGTTRPTVETPPPSATLTPAPPRDNCPDGFVRFPQGGEWACKRHNQPLPDDAETWRCPDTGYLFWVPAGQGDKSKVTTPASGQSSATPGTEPAGDCDCSRPGYTRTTL